VIPIGDDNRGRRITPLVNWVLILTNLGVFIYQLTLPMAELEQFVFAYGAVPAEVIAAVQAPSGDRLPIYATVFTSMFMHGSIAHFLGNMLFLWVFGDNIEDAMGHIGYLLFYLAGGIAASTAHMVFDPASTVPMIGASGAISAVMGAYLLLFPTGMVRVLVFIGIPLIFMVPALLMLGLWFATQLMAGVAALEGAGEAAGGIAFWAHIGGFVAGAVQVWFFRDPYAVQRQKAARSGRRAFSRMR
jgi:membrane associated rhomboid family serine protease